MLVKKLVYNLGYVCDCKIIQSDLSDFISSWTFDLGWIFYILTIVATTFYIQILKYLFLSMLL